MKFSLNVGLSSVQAGQKNGQASVEPMLIAKSTDGGFQLTAAASKALGVSVGENVFFANNIDQLRAVVAQKTEDVVKVAEALGVDINTVEGQNAVIDSCTEWYIGKGYALYDKTGNPLQVTVRTSKEEKQKFLDEHKAELVENNREALIERVGNPNATDEELAASITVDDVPSPQVDAFYGSKTSSPSNATGTAAVHFTDNFIWNNLKSDLEDKNAKNRKFKVITDAPVTYKEHNGKEEVEVTVYRLEFLEDVDPIVRGKKESAE